MKLQELAQHRVDDICLLNSRIAEFWQDGGWAPRDAANLLAEAKLDWQGQLSRTLALWLDVGSDLDQQGRLILGWANLGALIEGTMKWFLCVYENNYAENPLTKKFGGQQGQVLEPAEFQLNELIKYFDRFIWATQLVKSGQSKWYRLTRMIQQRRNSIHAFQDHELGTHDDLLTAICRYWNFVWDMNSSVPYPEDCESGPAPYQELVDFMWWDTRDEKRGIPPKNWQGDPITATAADGSVVTV